MLIKIKKNVLVLLVLLTYSASILSFSSVNTEEKAKYEVLRFYAHKLQIFKESNRDLKKYIGKPAELRTAFLKLRITFKYIEAVLLYVESNEARDINAPNIIVNEYDSLAPEPIYPHGLQVMEDLIYQNEISYEELRQEIDRLDILLAKISQRIQKRYTYDSKDFHAVIWDAMRYNIYRIESLGITGFDVPKSKNALVESRASLMGTHKILAIYKPLFQKKSELQLFNEGETFFIDAIEYLRKNNDFDSFDRLVFIKKYLHPLSVWLKRTIDKMGWQMQANVRPLDIEGEHLFSASIINPQYFLSGVNSDNIALGKKLFNDPILSGDGTRTCASCHQEEKAFADGLTKPLSVNGELLLRNTPTLWNAGLQTKLFYDSRVKKLEKQALDVIHNKEEMGGDLLIAAEKMKLDSAYVKAFGQLYYGRITPYSIVVSLSAYIRSLISFDSRFDGYMRNENITLSAAEKNGFNLFAGKAKCATCHFIPFFNGLVPPNYGHTESEILGVPQNVNIPHVIDPDQGRYLHTRLQLHKFAFKTPDIRNASLTAPYMHNGAFATLEEVLVFYNNGGGAGHGMDLPSQTLPTDSLHLSNQEMDDIISFIKTLSDPNGKR